MATFIESAHAIIALREEVLERVKQTRDAARIAFSDEFEQCAHCGAPIYDNEPCCEGVGE